MESEEKPQRPQIACTQDISGIRPLLATRETASEVPAAV